MRGNKERKVIIGAVIVVLILVTLFVVLQVPRRVRLLFPTEKTIEQDVKKYLKKRYKQDFHVTNIIPPSYEYASYIITVYPYGKPMDEEHKATVQGWEKDGLITYYDNYAMVKLIPELKEYISNIVKEEFPENKVYVSICDPEWYRENLYENISLKEFLKNKHSQWYNCVLWHICVPYGGEKEDVLLDKANNSVELMGENNISGIGFIDIIYNKYDDLPITWGNQMLGENGRDFIDLDYYIDRDGKFHKKLEVK